MSPVNYISGMADGVESPEGNITGGVDGQLLVASPGSKSTAWRKSQQVNVGGPSRPAGIAVSMNKCKSEDIETAGGKSDGS